MRRTAFVLGTNLLLGVGGLAWLLRRFGGPAVALLRTRPSGALLAAFAVAVAAAFIVFALRWRMLLAALTVPPRLGRLTAFRAAGQSLSSLIPSGKLGGEPLRVWLLLGDRLPAGHAIASVAVDRALEAGASTAFACVFALVLLRRGVPELTGALVTVSFVTVGLVVGVVVVARRLRRGASLVAPFARLTGLERFGVVRNQLAVIGEAEAAAAGLVAEPGRLARAFAIGVAANLVVFLEYHLLLAAFGLPASPVAVVAALFATGAAHSLPVPAAIGVLEGTAIWLFGILGHPPDVGLAVGLAVRLREIVWVVPGLVYLGARAVATGVRPRVLASEWTRRS